MYSLCRLEYNSKAPVESYHWCMRGGELTWRAGGRTQEEVEAEFDELSGQVFKAKQQVHTLQAAFNESEAKR